MERPQPAPDYRAHTWRMEYFGPDGECYVAIFSGPDDEARANAYADWLARGEN